VFNCSGAPRWLKIWWCEGDKEFGQYKKGFHYVNGQRQMSMSWDEASNVIHKLVRGLTRRGTIPAYKNLLKEIEYKVMERCGQLQGSELLAYELITDDMTMERALTFCGRGVELECEGGAILPGCVVDVVAPSDEDVDRRIYFTVQFDGGTESLHYEDLSKVLVATSESLNM
jgi:hypothetical protein